MFESTVSVWTDASESGWGAAYVATEPELEEEIEIPTEAEAAEETDMTIEMEMEDGTGPVVTFGLWENGRMMENCMRELNAVVQAIEYGLNKGIIADGMDIKIRSDNTNVIYNLNKKRSGWRMRKAIKALLKWLKERRIRLWCKHIAGEKNTVADGMSRLSRGGDYYLITEAVMKAERELGEEAEVDLFAMRKNRRKERYCTVDEKDGKAEAVNAMYMDTWAGFVGWLHPPIPMIAAALAKVSRDRATAILVGPSWIGQMWSSTLKEMTVRKVILGRSNEVLVAGAKMKKIGASLPPGMIVAYLIQGSGE
jgi:hypothetical protein